MKVREISKRGRGREGGREREKVSLSGCVSSIDFEVFR